MTLAKLFLVEIYSFGGSTLKVMGENHNGATGEWSIIGGTGKLSMARGTIKYKVVSISEFENYKQLDIYAVYTSLAVSPYKHIHNIHFITCILTCHHFLVCVNW